MTEYTAWGSEDDEKPCMFVDSSEKPEFAPGVPALYSEKFFFSFEAATFKDAIIEFRRLRNITH